MAIVSNEDKELDDFKKEMKREVNKEEEKAKKSKHILLNLGFHKKQNGDDKEQYIKKEGALVIGRTFSEKFSGGKFWAIQNDNFLKEEEVKTLKTVQMFYSVRDGKKQLNIDEGVPLRQKKSEVEVTQTAIINDEEMNELETEIGKLAVKLQICVRKSHEIVEEEIGKENITEGTRATLVKSFAATLFIEASRRGLGR